MTSETPGVLAVDQKRCILCSACRNACERGAVAVRAGTVIIDEAKCNGCGACVDACVLEVIALRLPSA